MSSEPYQLPDIEPLSDLSWRRVEQGVFRTLDAEASHDTSAQTMSRRPRWRVAAGWSAIGAFAAAAIVLLLVRNGGEDGSHTSRVATAESSSMVTIGDASLTVAPRSTVVVNESNDGAVAVMLERGAVHCAVAPRDGRPPFVVNAGDVRVEVVGTRFSVTREGDSARVVVDRGVVTIYSRGDRLELASGESWPAEEPISADADSNTDADAVAEGADRVAVAEADVELEIEPEVIPKNQPRADKRAHAKNDTKKAEPKPSAKERYRTAARLESTDPDAALAIYRELSKAGGPWAATALYAMGRLQADLGRTAAAHKTLEAYLKRYPAGGNAQDARAVLEQLK